MSRFIRSILPALSGRWKISKLLNVSFLIIIALPILGITYLSLQSYRNVLLENVTSRAMQTLEQVSYTVESQTSRIIQTAAAIANDQEVMENATGIKRSVNTQEQFNFSKGLDKQLYNYYHYTSDIISIAFFFKGTGLYTYKAELSQDEAVMRASPWFNTTIQADSKVKLFGAQDNLPWYPEGDHKVTVAIAPKFQFPFNDVELIYFSFHASMLEKLLTTRVPDGGDLYLLDPDRSIITSSLTEAIQNGIGNDSSLDRAVREERGSYVANVNGRHSYVIYITGENGWKYIQVLPYERLTGQVNEVYRRSLLLTMTGLSIFLFASFLVTRSIVKPILSLMRQMNKVKIGSFDAQIKASGPTEVYVLGTTFNEMVLRMKELIQEREQKDKEKNRAEIDALQSQINPHFLLNTMNAIKLMAQISKADHIRKMAEALTKLLSSAFNRGGSYTTVAEEMQLLEHYFYIMRIRFGDSFDVETDLEPSLRDLYLLRLLLQPIVENAVIHGLHAKEGQGLIRITGRAEGESAIRFVIEDNGVGMSPDRLEQVMQAGAAYQGFNGMGLRNVQQRIRLNYGEAYGMEVHSESGKGTRVVIRLPRMTEPADYFNQKEAQRR